MKLNQELIIALFATSGIAGSLILKYLFNFSAAGDVLLLLVLAAGGGPLLWELGRKVIKRQFGSDLLAGISILTSFLLGEYLAGAIVVLMLSGGEALENYALGRASEVLGALAKRMPHLAHQKTAGGVIDVPLQQVKVGELLVILPHEICPVDGVVEEGHTNMDESFLTGEPFLMSKGPGSEVISGALNGNNQLVIRATRRAVDSRYAKITEVLRAAEQNRPRIRRIADQLGALYTPLAVALAVSAWVISGEAHRFLAVLVVATPCPLLIAVPIAIIGSISLCAKRGIIVRDPSVLEQLESCKTIIFDKTGTLTYGRPKLTEQIVAPGFTRQNVLGLVASLENYSKHPLSNAIVTAAREEKLELLQPSELSEKPGYGLQGVVDKRRLLVTSRNKALEAGSVTAESLPPIAPGLECVILVDGKYAATYRFHDAARSDSRSFVEHLGSHDFTRVMLVSGDRQSEVQYLADLVGIREVYHSVSPEQKVEIVQAETKKAKTVFIGDGINDAPALVAATAGIAFGQNSDITTEAAQAVIMEASLSKVDEFFHITRRMRRVVLQSAVGGMALSVIGMILAANGALSPVAGAVTQEAIDLLAVLNALRAAFEPRHLTDYARGT